jgi:alkanesulfonate monooxygenase SsuD/methylene tetrahydromethanopterin reductase-like flavin-dependent oxidoreductase (luciferase family)
VKLGVITLQNAPWPELVERWRRLEELGVETIWVADHLGNWMHPQQPWFEAWSCLTALAHVTQRPRIGPLVSAMTLRNPAVLARTALTVAELSGGRLELGVGSGGAAYDHKLAEVPKWEPKERAALFARWLERLLELLADERLQPKCELPLTVAGRGKTILSLAARHASRWNTFGGVGLTPEEGLRRGREDNARLDELCAEAGRTVLRSALIGYPFVAETPWRSDEAFQDFVARWQEAGFEELVVYYPPETGMPAGSVTPGVFETAFAQAGPRRRALPADAGS